VAPGQVDALVRLIDVTPTLLDLLGVGALEGAEGRSLAPLMRGESLPALPAWTEFGERRRVMDGRYSLIAEPQAFELYDLEADPGEQRELSGERAGTLAGLRELLRRHAERPLAPAAPESEARPLDAETREALEALGYL
jgi:arylsulfatase A-like enzyme